MKKILPIILIFLVLSSHVFALGGAAGGTGTGNVVDVRDGKLVFNKLTDQRNFQGGFNDYMDEYRSNSKDSAKVRGSFGQMSNGSVNVDLKSGAKKKTAFKNLLENARKGKKAIGGWFGIAATFVAPFLLDAGFEWLEEQQDFVKSKPNIDAVCIIGTNYAPDARRCVYEGSGLTIKGRFIRCLKFISRRN